MNIKNYKIAGALLAKNNDGTCPFPSSLNLIFENQKNYYIQVAIKGPHPQTYLEIVEYVPFNKDCFENCKKEDFLIFKIDDTKYPSVDKNFKIYALALSSQNVLLGNLNEYTSMLENLKINSEYINFIKETFATRKAQFEKFGFSSQDKFTIDYLNSHDNSKGF